SKEDFPSKKPSPFGRGLGEGVDGEESFVSDRERVSYRGGAKYSSLVNIARELRKNQTSAEKYFWEIVRDRKLFGLKFRRQHQIGNYITDFFCNELSLVVELDGEVHFNSEQMEKDKEKDDYYISQGFKVLRFKNEEILVNIESVFDKILKLLPSPSGRRAGDEGGNEQGELLKDGNDSTYGSRKGGVVWHTQGSGKSLSMVFYAGKLVLSLNNPTIVVITDRNDLDDQLFDTFAASKQLLRQEPVQAESRDHLKKLLTVASGGIVFTTIQKFSPEGISNEYDQLSDRSNIVVIADEAHRTQYGFEAVMRDVKDKETKEVIGKRIAYGFAKYIRDALPNATYIGFTGTPIEGTDVNTPQVFGNYVDIYDISQSVADGTTVRIYYESRLAKVNLDEEGKQLIKEFDDSLTQPLPEEEENSLLSDGSQQAKAKWSKLEAIIGSPKRIKNLAKDIVYHFEERQKGMEGKGMIVAMSRRIAVDLYNEIISLRPDWHNEDITKGAIKVIMTAASSDGPVMMKQHTTKSQRKSISDRMKDPDDPLKLVIVRDMWLTGFDAPCLHTMYIDKPMRGHTLMQAIARVNRVFKDKPGGLVVDYLGIGTDLKKALSFYSDSGGKGDPAETQEKAVDMMMEKLEIVNQMFISESKYRDDIAAEDSKAYMGDVPGSGFNFKRFFSADSSNKLTIILEAEEHILGLEDGKSRFINEVNLLSQAFAIAVPHEKAMEVKDDIAFFQAVKARMVKFTGGTGRNGENYDYETAIKQIVDQALSSDEVVDIFDAAGIKKPEISILSDEFLLEVKNMKHKNLAIELLKKILNNEIKTRSVTNLVKSRALLEMLESSIKKYQNNLLTTAEIIQELIDIANEIKKADQQGIDLGLSTDEVAFYNALEVNESAVKVLGDEKLKLIAREIADKVKKNATIDWTIRESARAKLMVLVKRTLKKYGYPPDMQQKAVDTVLKQAEMMAEYFTKN
ncbi:MAG TPA: HsdR family type I site-specific deoxyribonuclease, partial [Ignavibacteria bacterium]|nr:HsdR family type I site-specific deoxyribonuclease [Ignavibacteria bacterium]